MDIIDISDKEYASIFPVPYHIFNTAAFNVLNCYKCNEVWYLLFKDTKIRFGLILGKNGDIVSSPFSAPFGGFSYLTNQLHQEHIDEALEALDDYLITKSIHSIRVTLPPLCYDHLFLPKLINSLSRNGYLISSVELDHVFQTIQCDQFYENILYRNARKNLQASLKQNLLFKKTTDLKSAYDIIEINRNAKGFPLRMTFEQLESTTTIISCDVFVVEFEQTSIASAIVYHVAPKIVLVVYWGDVPAYSSMRTMNFLSYKIFEYYKNEGIRLVDIGPSTQNGIPNFGLCEFKESIGCIIELKLFFEKNFVK